MFATPDTLKRLYDPILTSDALVSYYSRLKQRTRRGLCPYCEKRDVRTLDHFLPKSKYPDFSVTPYNLVPCCGDCNSDKSAKVASTADGLCFHPFFDDWASYRLIVAEISYPDETDVDITFRVSADESIPELVRSREWLSVRIGEGVRLLLLKTDVLVEPKPLKSAGLLAK